MHGNRRMAGDDGEVEEVVDVRVEDKEVRWTAGGVNGGDEP